MKLAIVFDAKFSYYKGQYYSRNLTEEFYKKRYFPYVDEIVVVGRKVSVEQQPKDTLVQSSKIQFRCLDDISPYLRPFLYWKEYKFIKQAIADCDAVAFRGWWGCAAAKDLKKPYMVEVVGDTWNAYWYHSLLGKLVAVPLYLLTRHAIKNAPYVLYVTKQFLQKKYPTKGIQTGISDVELLENTTLKNLQQRLEKIRLSGRPLILGTAAAMNVKFKGQEYVIEALKLLKKKGYLFHYQLVGGGSWERLSKLAQKLGVADQVHFLGTLPHHQIFNWYDQLDIYIQPSLQEGLPRAVVEAMSRALPCIGARTGGIPELIDPSCIYIPRGNMAKKIALKLLTFTPQKMEIEANYNFKHAQNFQEEILKISRDNFMNKFMAYVKKAKSDNMHQ